MKKLVATIAFALPALASAETIYTTVGGAASCVGQHFKVSDANDILYKDRACKLPIVHKNEMRQYVFSAQGMTWDGCWGSLLGNRVLLISSDGSESIRSKLEFIVANTDQAGNAVVTKSPAEEMEAAQGRKLCP
ncbi:hypothetical protein [Burkholderia multivorans]|uniref:Bacteriophage protein n=1 Tax=Burkholderia multivorans (strain ATCC 17616 / 249) TaxID=395019 RepID=A0A0H3KE40_BURM1|nr:hypothetical protein [Burkholderia multivorans]ABX15495.1 hypothetical protein Bmul_1807 [Burkholderia multivorans ATCC 17616]PRF58220.1 hypothetical protein C6Q28_18670 [Burkholderia multivorans]BAG43367.1 putative bacteriophage protein [Burkholderia multivorans ATCC 17616]HEJ2441833.1 hypothetical protein [Burkholderia multivorans]